MRDFNDFILAATHTNACPDHASRPSGLQRDPVVENIGKSGNQACTEAGRFLFRLVERRFSGILVSGGTAARQTRAASRTGFSGENPKGKDPGAQSRGVGMRSVAATTPSTRLTPATSHRLLKQTPSAVAGARHIPVFDRVEVHTVQKRRHLWRPSIPPAIRYGRDRTSTAALGCRRSGWKQLCLWSFAEADSARIHSDLTEWRDHTPTTHDTRP